MLIGTLRHSRGHRQAVDTLKVRIFRMRRQAEEDAERSRRFQVWWQAELEGLDLPPSAFLAYKSIEEYRKLAASRARLNAERDAHEHAIFSGKPWPPEEKQPRPWWAFWRRT
jgi:hypothetical protein